MSDKEVIVVKRSLGAVIRELEERVETERELYRFSTTDKERQRRNATIQAYEISLSIAQSLYTEEIYLNDGSGKTVLALPWDSEGYNSLEVEIKPQ